MNDLQKKLYLLMALGELGRNEKTVLEKILKDDVEMVNWVNHSEDKFKLKDWQKSVIIVGSVSIIMYLLLTYVILWGIIPSESMEPTLEVCDYAINNGLAYVTHEPQRGDINIFTGHEQGMDGETLIKRIIGIPGDDLMFVDGNIYLNGKLLEADYLPDGTKTYSQKDFEVPEDCYFVMGDNRDDSFDSRFWDDPFVKKVKLRGN